MLLLMLFSMLGMAGVYSSITGEGMFGAEDENLEGSEDNDVLAGSKGDDLIRGGGGEDLILSGAGDDTIEGGDGDDMLIGGEFPDVDTKNLEGNATAAAALADAIVGDIMGVITGGSTSIADGTDYYDGGAGDDIILDGLSDENDQDTLIGGDGVDLLMDFDGSSTLLGGSGDDMLIAMETLDRTFDGQDILDGGDGNDTLIGDHGDTLIGGAGDDFFYTVYTGDEDVVEIDDYENGEIIYIDYDDSDAISASRANVSISIRDTAEGAMLSYNGDDLMLVRDVLASQLSGNVYATAGV